MSHLLALLNEMRSRRVAMYVGSTSLSKLADFLRGYEHALYHLLPSEKDPLLANFRDWIYQRFQTTEKMSWEGTILRHSTNEAEAVQHFWDLLDEYLAQRERPHAGCSAIVAPAAEVPSQRGEDRHGLGEQPYSKAEGG